MLPCASHHDVINILPIEAILTPKFGSSVYSRDVLSAHLTNQIISHLSMHDTSSTCLTTTRDHVIDVVDLRSLNDVTRVDASRRIASMTSTRSRPVIIHDEKGDSMSKLRASVKIQATVPILIKAERIQEACIGDVRRDGRKKPVNSRGFARIMRHRCLPEASVLGGYAATDSYSPFQFTRLVKEDVNALFSTTYPRQTPSPTHANTTTTAN